ncbi:DUF11 domain-containing protein [Bradyrhizobium arachidis]|uniref:beta strand repeat-containing protein n=1 Tax=Bradyrhizobium arachidis TaxID=858423 RepID=UPI0021631AE2|nr:hypothetical protein [Bradyrhizobium arachidis]UVO39390.1 DUF11 domain-containing protein [Bradyrhizobium arachidis]
MVEFTVAHDNPGPDGVVGTADDVITQDLTGTTQPWFVVDGGSGDLDGLANGVVMTSWYVNADAANQSFLLSAVDQTTQTAATTSFTDKASAQLDDWSDGKAPDAIGGNENWGNGDLNTNNSHYFEGDSVPFRATFAGLVVNQTYSITLSYDTTKSGKHAFDYLTTYNATLPAGHTATEANPDPTIGTAFTESGTHDTLAIPVDAKVAAGANGVIGGGDDITQQPSFFTMWGGDMTATSAYTLSGSYTGDSDTSITITFTATDTTAVLAWAAHIATEADWGVGTGAFNISGSPYHMALLATDTVSASKADHQMQAAVVFTPPAPSDTVTKEVLSITSTDGVPGTTVVDHAGDIINYAVTVTNTGNEALHVTSVADSLPGVSLTLFSGDINNDNLLDTTEVWVYHGSYTVTQTDMNNGAVGGGAPGFVHNVATVTTQETGPLTGEANTPITQNPNFTIAKDVTSVTGGSGAGNLSADGAGDVVNYNIVLTNTGNETLTGVTLSDPFATTLSAPVESISANGKLDVGETWTYTATHTVTQADIDGGGPLVNLATGDTDQTVAKSDDASTPVIQNPNFTIAKDVTSVTGGSGAGNLSADGAGDVVNYNIVLTNTGNETLTGVTLSDPFATTLSAPVESISANGKLDVGETWTYTATHTVTQADIDGGGPLVNLATGDTDQTVAKSDDASTPVIQNPNFTIAKDVTSVTGGSGAGNLSADGAGDVVNYNIVLTNTGNETLTGVTLSDPFATTLSAPVESISANGKLDVGETWTYTATHTVTQADIDGGGPLVNLATGNTDQTVAKSDDASTPVIQNPNFTIAKDVTSVTGGSGAGNLSADGAGDVVNYNIVLTNTGNETLTGVTLSDPFATTLSAPVESISANGKLDVGETWTYTATHTVTQADIDGGGPLVNLATGDTDQTVAKSDDASTPVIQNPNFTIAKDVTSVTGGSGAGNLSADGAGDVVNYNIVLTNTGNETLTGVTLSDPFATTLSAPVESISANGKLDVGETWTYTATHTVTQADIDGGGPLVNLATGDTDQTVAKSDDASTPVIQNPNFTIAKDVTSVTGGSGAGNLSADGAGDVVNYNIVLTNTGNETLTGVTLSDPFATTLSAPVESISANGKLDVGETWTYTATHTVTQADIDGGGPLVNLATGDTDQTVAKSDDASTPVIQNPNFTIAKDVTSVTGGSGAGNLSADGAGDVVNYNIVLTNTGNETLTGVTLSDPFATTLSAPVESISANGKLDVGETWTYTATHTVTQADIDGGGPLVNLATGDTDQTVAKSDDASTPVIQNPNFTIAKDVTSVTGGSGAGNLSADGAGDVVNYNIVLTNTGNETLTGVTLSDPFATTLSAPVESISANGKLDVGETWTYTATHTVTQAEMNAGTNLVNLATGDTAQTDAKSDDASTPVIQNPALTITKTAVIADGHADHAGDVIHYSVVVDNTGNIDLHDVVVTDTFEGGVPIILDTDHSTLTTADDAILTGDTNGDGVLDVTETWTYTYDHVVTQNELDTRGIDGDNSLDNLASVTTTETGLASDDAHVPVALGPGVRTPGFWSQTNGNTNWTKFWDGIVGNESKQSGTNGFPNGEITLAVHSASSTGHLVDTNGDGVFTSADNAPSGKTAAGLLIGDFNLDGIQDNGESTFFINFSDALSLLNANQKQLGNAEYQEGRALVATWLNYLAGNPIEASDPTKVDAKDAIQWGVDWLLKTTAQTDGNITLNDMNSHAVAAGSTPWNVGIDGPDGGSAATAYAQIPHYNPALDIPGGVQILGVLDEYNNHGTVYGTVIATTP